jgi:hypothetical protein
MAMEVDGGKVMLANLVAGDCVDPFSVLWHAIYDGNGKREGETPDTSSPATGM